MQKHKLIVVCSGTLLALALAGCGDDGGYGGSSGGTWNGDSSASGSGGTSGGDESGGDAEPDDTGVETGLEDPGMEDCDDQDPTVLYLSPDDSNSMSSPVQVREAVLSGWSSLGAVPIRTWEFLNYYSFDYPAADPDRVTLSAEMSRDEDGPADEYVLQIGVGSEHVADGDRAPLNVTLVLDESGSMSGQPMDMLKETCRALAASLREGDVVSMVTWDTNNAVALAGYAVTGPSDPTVVDRIDALASGGGTDLHGGLTAGYDLALQAYDASRINRIVLVSDGGANVGITDIDLIAEHAGGNNEDGIYMVGVGVGTPDTYNDELMDTVTDVGKGASVFIANEDEAWKIFRGDFVNTLAVAVRDVQVRLDLPPGFEIVRFSGEEYSEDPSEIEPQHLAPNDAMVFHQRIKTCAPDLVADDTPVTIVARYKDAITFEQHELSLSTTFAELLGAESAELLKGAAVFGYAEALKEYKAASDPAKRAAIVNDALDAVAAAEQQLAGDTDLAEIRSVLEAL